MLKVLRRELYVVIHGQSFRFRVIKYVTLIGLVSVIYRLFGKSGLFYFFTITLFLGFSGHFLFRWKTNAWKKSWGPYKKISIPNE